MLSTYKYKIFQFTQKCFNISLWEIVAQSFALWTDFGAISRQLHNCFTPRNAHWFSDSYTTHPKSYAFGVQKLSFRSSKAMLSEGKSIAFESRTIAPYFLGVQEFRTKSLELRVESWESVQSSEWRRSPYLTSPSRGGTFSLSWGEGWGEAYFLGASLEMG